MKKRKLGFILTIIIVPYVLQFLAVIAVFVPIVFLTGSFSDNTEKQSLSGDLEVTITQERDTITLDANQQVEAIYYNLSGVVERECPSYVPPGTADPETDELLEEYQFDEDWEEYQSDEGIGIVYPLHGSLCYTVVSDSSNFETDKYEIDSASLGSFVATVSLIFIPMLLVFLSQLLLYIYMIYWLVQTKRELQALGADDIPTTWLYIVPLANIYYIYKYAEGANKVTNGKLPPLLILIVYLLGASFVVMPVCQSQYNKISRQTAPRSQPKSER